MTDNTPLPQFFEISVKCLALALRLLAATLQHCFGERGTGVDSVHVDTEGPERVRQGLCQGDAGDVAGRSADRGAWRASGAAAQVNDPTPTGPLHVRRHLAGAAVVAEKFFFEVLDDLLVADHIHIVRDGAADSGGAVSQDMNSTQGVSRVPDESFDRFRVECVRNQWKDITSGLPGDLCGSLAQRSLGPGADRNVATLVGQLPSYCFAHAAAAAGDDCLFALKPEIHPSSSFRFRRLPSRIRFTSAIND